MIPRKELQIPLQVSGRIVTNRGVHLLPAAYHGDWLKKASYWTDLLVSMDISWVVILNSGDSVRQTYTVGVDPIKVLLDAGIIPIIREHNLFPLPFTDRSTFEWTVDRYGEYGLKPLWVIRNEPYDPREWVNGRVSRNFWDATLHVWLKAAEYMASHGGYVGFPDGPAYRSNPFEEIRARGGQPLFDDGHAFYAGHHYGKNRHRDYPYDAVTQHGTQLTEDAYRRLLDDYADDRSWWEEAMELINERRTAHQSLGLTAVEDDTCWRGWEKVAHWSLQTFGYVVPMAMTEGGWVPRDRPGSGQDTDIRVPHTTPRMVAKKTLQILQTPSPFFALCPWLLADDAMAMAGYVGWPYDSWVGWAYADRYGPEKPVVDLLRRVSATALQRPRQPMVLDIEGDTRDWVWLRQTHGTHYRRGPGTVKLIEVHEYEGPPALDVRAVDEAGLPVEGVPFFYYYPGAPNIRDGRPDAGVEEWYADGVPGRTGADGRLSFPVAEEAGSAGSCQGALWPEGRGDLLQRVGLLVGTKNRHVNSLWRVAASSTAGSFRAESPGAPPPAPPSSPPDKWALLSEKLDRIEELLDGSLEIP